MFGGPIEHLTLLSTRTTALLLTSLAVLAAVGGAMGVPDARITVDSVSVGPSDPVVGERTDVDVTVTSSVGSAVAANVTEIRLLDADGERRDAAVAPGALSPGDSVDATLWTTFDEPGEHRLTVEVVATEPADDDDAPEVRVQRDVVVDVAPAETSLDLRVRPLSPEDLSDDDDADAIDVGGIGGIDGLLGGGGGGGLDTGEDDPAVGSLSSPVAVTVVNTGTAPADRVSVTASSTGVAGDVEAAIEAQAVEAGPFVVEDIAPGEERRVVADLGPLDRQSNVTFTATFRSSVGPPDADGAAETVSAELLYPPRDGRPTVTGATVAHEGDDRVVVDANLANTGDRAISGVVVDVAAAEGVAATPDGGAYFVGVVGESDFVPVELHTTVNASVAESIPLRVEYTDRGVRYVETIDVALPSAESDNGSSGQFGVLSGIGPGSGSDTGVLALGLGILGLVGVAAAGIVVRRRHV